MDGKTEVQRGEAAYARVDGWSVAELYCSRHLWDMCGAQNKGQMMSEAHSTWEEGTLSSHRSIGGRPGPGSNPTLSFQAG